MMVAKICFRSTVSSAQPQKARATPAEQPLSRQHAAGGYLLELTTPQPLPPTPGFFTAYPNVTSGYPCDAPWAETPRVSGERRSTFAGRAPTQACRCPAICRGNVRGRGGEAPRGRTPPAHPRLSPPVSRVFPSLGPAAPPVPKRRNAGRSSYGRVLKWRLRRGPGSGAGCPPGAAGASLLRERRPATPRRRLDPTFRVLGPHRRPRNRG